MRLVRSLAVRRAALGLCCAVAVTSLAARAHATEHEWQYGASAGFASIDFPHGLPRSGVGGGLDVRYGLSDAFDLTMEATTYGYAWDKRLMWGSSVGIDYVIDISRWMPTVGGTAGVVDLVGLACADDPFRCGHQFMAALGPDATLAFRVIPKVPLGVRFEYQFLFGGGPASQLFVGVYGAFAN